MLATCMILYFGGLAQIVERALSMCEVAGSIPASTKSFSGLYTKNAFKKLFLDIFKNLKII